MSTVIMDRGWLPPLSVVGLSVAIVISRVYFHAMRRAAAAAAAAREREARLQLAIDGSGVGFWHWNLHTQKTHFSPRVYELLGYAPADTSAFIGAFLEVVHPEDRHTVTDGTFAQLQHDRRYDAELRLRLKSGEYRWFRIRGYTDLDIENRPSCMAGSITDINERKRVQAAISRQAMQQGLIAEFGQMALKKPSTSELWSHAATVVSKGLAADCCRLLGADGDDKSLTMFGGFGWNEEWSRQQIFDAAAETEDRFITGVREFVVIEEFDRETRYKPSAMLRAHRLSSGVEMLISGAEDAHGLLGVYSRLPREFDAESVNFLRGVANILANSLDRHVADQRLKHMAKFDSLTGLPNRSMFLDQLWQTIDKAERDGTLLAVIFVDLDRFKLVNDTLGHSAGDQVLLQVAQRLSQHTYRTQGVGRLGGDEFVIALGNLAHPADAGLLVQEILSALTVPFEVVGRELYVSASAGIGIYPTDGKDPASLLASADTAMYKAKQCGKNTYQFYAPKMHDGAVERLSMETELRGALDRNELTIHYQPKVNIFTGEISGFEALLRWQHPERGLIPPAQFISILEDTGLIVPAGEWVIETACKQLREWRAAALPVHPIAVNVSVRQFSQKDLHVVIPQILERFHIAPDLIELELTESLLMTDSEAAAKMLNAFKSRGIRISIDDFGTGYSSLAYLRRFPLDALKIDRAFIRDIPSDSDGAAIVLAIINLAHTLKLKVIAEGVETDNQLNFLREHGCDEIQGYYFARPQPAEECTRMLRAGWKLRLSERADVQRLARQDERRHAS